MLPVYLNHPLTTSTAFDTERHFFMAYSLDTTGLAPSNYVAIETHLVTPQSLANYAYVLLNHGPFFGNNLQVIYTPRNGLGVVLSLGEDYQPIFELEGFGDTTGTKVWGAISLTNPALLGSIQVSYQSLGGNWTFSNPTIFAYLNSNYFDAATQRIVLVSNGPLRLPNNPNVDWPINSRQSVAIAQAQLPVVDLIVKYEYIDNAIQANPQYAGSSGNPLFVSVNNHPTQQSVSVETLPLPSNAAKESGGVLDNMAQNLLAQRITTGGVQDVLYNGTGDSTVISALKGIFNAIAEMSLNLAVWQSSQTPSDTGPIKIEGGNLIAVKTDGSSITQPVSAAALPLPDNAASETGNLLNLKINTDSLVLATGSRADLPYSGGADATLISLLKAIESTIYTSDEASLNTNILAKEEGGHLQVSADALTELLNSTGRTNSISVTQDGNSNIIGLLKGIYEYLSTTIDTRQLNAATDSVSVSSAFTPSFAPGGGVISASNSNSIALSENLSRRFLQIQNTHATADIYLNFAGLAYDSYLDGFSGFILSPGDTATYDVRVPSSQINVASTTANATYFIVEG